jgi:hypothetical protein
MLATAARADPAQTGGLMGFAKKSFIRRRASNPPFKDVFSWFLADPDETLLEKGQKVDLAPHYSSTSHWHARSRLIDSLSPSWVSESSQMQGQS